ncbi:hypothetical protein PEC18_34275 [Paucibacter sp. O1-1]|nr:hypothetical protein [Paucibacter sp. O1-1]MDA3830758.1 hypothetical protein [Paucibacter sp. O1-1]
MRWTLSRLFDYKIKTGSSLAEPKAGYKKCKQQWRNQYDRSLSIPGRIIFYLNQKHSAIVKARSLKRLIPILFDLPAYSNMTNANVVTPVDLRKLQKEGNLVVASKNGLRLRRGLLGGTSNPCIYVPSIISSQRIESNVAGPVFPEVTFNSYTDRGYATEYTSRNGMVTGLEWHVNGGNANLLSAETTGLNTAFAQTKSYQYQPLVGIKSMTDANGKVTFYDYDSFNRLKNVRGNNAAGPVRASYCYNYAGQPIDCAVIAAAEYHKSYPFVPIARFQKYSIAGNPGAFHGRER